MSDFRNELHRSASPAAIAAARSYLRSGASPTSIAAGRNAVRRDDAERQREEASRVPASVIGPIADSLALSPEAQARNAKAFAKADQRAEMIAEHANILGSYARMGVSRDAKATFNTLAWLMRELRPVIDGLEEAP